MIIMHDEHKPPQNLNGAVICEPGRASRELRDINQIPEDYIKV